MVCQVPSKTGGIQVAALENDVNSLTKLDLSMQAAIGRIFLINTLHAHIQISISYFVLRKQK